MTDCDLAMVFGVWVGMVTVIMMPRLYRWRWRKAK
jgi:hypothetical protein